MSLIFAEIKRDRSNAREIMRELKNRINDFKTSDPRWCWLYKVGGMAALLAGYLEISALVNRSKENFDNAARINISHRNTNAAQNHWIRFSLVRLKSM